MIIQTGDNSPQLCPVISKPEIIRSYREHYNYAMGKLFDVAGCPLEAYGKGSYIYDEKGNPFLDWCAGFGVFSLGHGNGEIRKQIMDQVDKLTLLPPGCSHPLQQRFFELFAGLLPSGLNQILIAGSGSEACEYALRTVLLNSRGKKKILAARNSYHGKTLGALCVMGQSYLRDPFGPFHIEVEFIRYGDIGHLKEKIDADTMAVFLEPVLGGGYLQTPPPGYLQEVSECCVRHGALLVLDEVQTGFGRTGSMFAFEQEQIVPDILITSKAISGGLIPIAAIVVKDNLSIRLPFLEKDSFHGSPSWQGSLLACAAASASIDFITREQIPAQVAEKGNYLKERLMHIVRRYPKLAIDVPGKGLMLGIRLRSVLIEHAIWLQLLSRNTIGGLSTNSVTRTPVLRVFPPLTISYGEMDEGLEALEASFYSLNRWPGLILGMANKAFAFHHYIPGKFMRVGCSLFKLDLSPGTRPHKIPASPVSGLYP
ncbi:aspartate aminotransferase family protein [Flavitalea flava]